MGRAIEIPERLEGSRVVLRPLAERDLAPYAAAFVADPTLGPAAGSETDPDEEQLRAQLARAADLAREGALVELAIADAVDDRLLGSLVLHSFDWRHERTEVGFWLVAGERGRGVATEAVAVAVALALEWAFGELGMHRVEMVTLPALPHIDAVLALADRLGFQHEGLMRERNLERDRHLDTVMLAVLRREWEARDQPGVRPAYA